MRCGKLLAALAPALMGTAVADAQVLVPEGIKPGDGYHLVFVTEGTRDATSADIADYNTFVQEEAARAGAISERFDVDWFAIGSTAAIDAKDNAVVEGPVYLLDGLTKVADGFEDIWNNPLDVAIDMDQFGRRPQSYSGLVITSTVSAFDHAPELNGTPGFWGPTGGLYCPLGGMCTLDTRIGELTFSDFPGHSDTNQTPGHMYALSGTLTVCIGPSLQAGDANMDYEYNQLDLVQVLVAAKYLTGQPATWGEGDWDGAPGGCRGNPPPGNGVFDQLDIIAAFENYLTGPYAGLAPVGDAPVSVPEPSTILLATLGFAGLLPLVWRRCFRPVGGRWDSADGQLPAGAGAVVAGHGLRDDKQTSTIHIPEPRTLMLVGIAIGMLAIPPCSRTRRYFVVFGTLISLMVSTHSLSAGQVSLSPESVIGGSGAWNSELWDSGAFAAGLVADHQSRSSGEGIDESDQGSGDANGGFWLGQEGDAEESFVLDLGREYMIERIELFQTHNGTLNDRSTNGFEIHVGTTVQPVDNANQPQAGGMDLVDPVLLVSGNLSPQLSEDDPIEPESLGWDWSVDQMYPAWVGSWPSPCVRYLRFSTQGPLHDDLSTNQRGVGLNEIRVWSASGGALQAGDADMDSDYDQYDWIKVLQAGKYLTGQPATWGEGDFDGAPGGEPGNPPPGNGVFDQLDMIAGLLGGIWLTGPYDGVAFCGAGGESTSVTPEPIAPGGVRGDDQTSVVYDSTTGEIAVDAPADRQLTSINIDSAAGVFEPAWDRYQNLDGSFDFGRDTTIFKATFGSSFGSISFGQVAKTGLSSSFVLSDLTVAGSLDGGGGLGDVDLVYRCGGFFGQDLTAVDFRGRDLAGACFASADLAGATFEGTNLTNASFSGATLTEAQFDGAIVQGADFSRTVSFGLDASQLYSTASYQQHDLRGIALAHNDLSGWDFARKNLAGAVFSRATLTGSDLSQANLTGADFRSAYLVGADLSGANIEGASLERAELTDADLRQVSLIGANLNQATLTGARLVRADLTEASFVESTLTSADLSGAVIAGASFRNTTSRGFTKEQLYSTASYQTKELEEIELSHNDVSGWSFAEQNLAGSSFWQSTLTGAELRRAHLTGANFSGGDLTLADMSQGDLAGASFFGATLSRADLTGAAVRGANFGNTTSRGFSKEQLYSTANYQVQDLEGIGLSDNDLSGWSFVGQNLAHADLSRARLNNADLDGAVVNGANFAVSHWNDSGHLTKEQLYSTASYQAQDLEGIGLSDNDLSGWNFAGQDLAHADLSGANLTRADLSGAVINDANFAVSYSNNSGHLTEEQLYSTASYQVQDLEGIGLSNNNLSDWSFAGQNLAHADLWGANLTRANLSGAVIKGANFGASYRTTSGRLTKEQLYATASYQAQDLEGIRLSGNNLSTWDFAGQNLAQASFQSATLRDADLSRVDLTNATLSWATLHRANLRNAIVQGADLSGTVSSGRGFSKEQLYSTASYRDNDLEGIRLAYNDLSGWNFVGQNLAHADLRQATLAEANLSFADLRNANLAGARLSTTNLRLADLRGATEANIMGMDSRFTINTEGSIDGLDLHARERMVVRDHELPINVTGSMSLPRTSTMEVCFEDATWGSSIQIGQGAKPELGGTLTLNLTGDAETEAMADVVFQLFEWNGQLPPGERFDQIVGQPGVSWDTQQLFTNGSVRLLNIAELMPGDSNRDLKFDQEDVVQVLQAGKYLTGEQATWGEGDWNGAPGGWWGHPPAGDGVFDQLDIVAALAANGYLAGLYAAVGGDANAMAAVPEPTSFALLVLGLATFVVHRPRRYFHRRQHDVSSVARRTYSMRPSVSLDERPTP